MTITMSTQKIRSLLAIKRTLVYSHDRTPAPKIGVNKPRRKKKKVFGLQVHKGKKLIDWAKSPKESKTQN